MRRALLIGVLALTGCTKAQIVDLTMASARHVPHVHRTVGPYEILAGDMHCHVLPPDAAYHVSRSLEETVQLAKNEGLDFVVLSPHVPRRFFLDPEMRDWVVRTQKQMRAKAESLASPSLVVIPGMEYTDHENGHLGLSFADVGAVLDAVPLADLEERPELFFETWQAMGGLSTINHPFLYALPRVPIAELHYDLSWRGFGPNAFPEIRWLTQHADAIETWNESVGHVRDRWFLGDPAWELRQATHLVDRMARAQERRIAPVGGSDSHGNWLRPSTFVLATDRTPLAIRDAVVHGRTCVHGPEACTLELRGEGAWAQVGAAISSGPDHVVTARTSGGKASYFVNGALVTATEDIVTIPVSGACSLVRVAINEGVSAPIYVDCPWASVVSGIRQGLDALAVTIGGPIVSAAQSMTGPPFSSAR